MVKLEKIYYTRILKDAEFISRKKRRLALLLTGDIEASNKIYREALKERHLKHRE